MFQKLISELLKEAGKEVQLKGSVEVLPEEGGKVKYVFDGTLSLPIVITAMLEGFASREQKHEQEKETKEQNHRYKSENEEARKRQ